MELHIDKISGNIPGFDLGKIKDVIDQLNQVVSATVNGLCITDLFFVQVTIMVLV